MDTMMVTGETTTPVAQTNRITRARVLEGAGLSMALLIAAALNFWNLAANGYGNTYYAVAVQSMLQSFSNFWYGAYDAGGFITVDKPPVALWIQAISAKLFGFNGLALLVPEALAGTVAVGLLYFLVRRAFGPLAGFVAAMTLAVTPIAVAVNRTNNMDTWLMFVLLLAAWALTYATEKGRLVLLCAGMALVGVAFNIKMLEAFIVLPAFYLLYFLAAPISWLRRIVHLAVASVALFGVAFSWPLAVDLTSPDARPYIGGSQNNSVFNLAFGYNGFGRVTGQGEGMPGGNRPGVNGVGPQGGFGPPTGGQGFPMPPNGAPGNFPPPIGGQGNFQPPPGAQDGPGGAGGPGGGTPFNSGTPGAGRLFGTELAGQWSWLFPLAAIGLGGRPWGCAAADYSTGAARRCCCGPAGWRSTASCSASRRASSTAII
jgi:4-amino-4-deoxy-L-arabinose transferase-like glycosyltransferase